MVMTPPPPPPPFRPPVRPPVDTEYEGDFSFWDALADVAAIFGTLILVVAVAGLFTCGILFLAEHWPLKGCHL